MKITLSTDQAIWVMENVTSGIAKECLDLILSDLKQKNELLDEVQEFHRLIINAYKANLDIPYSIIEKSKELFDKYNKLTDK